MCGFCVAVTLERSHRQDQDTNDESRRDLHSRLSAGLELIKHRGPDSQDIWINPDNTVALGHARLSIVDLSPAGEQPLHDDEGHIHAVVIGEIYDDDILRERCQREFGYKFRGHSDSEVVIALYKHYGAPGFLDHLRGEYSFVIYDDRSGEVFAARDRFGVKPLFWAVVDGKILFAPEYKAFLPLGWKPEWNTDSIMSNSCYIGTETIFKNVQRLKPGHYLTASATGVIQTHQYWDLEYRDKKHVETRPLDEIVQEVRKSLIDSIRVRLRADVPVGIYLSGGLDSSAVAGITKYLVQEKGEKIGSQDIRKNIACFTIQFDKESGFDESDIAERTAKFLGVDMHLADMNEAALAQNFEDAIWHNEHHTWDLGTVGKFALSELPRKKGFKVILSGEGADELFAGYPWFLPEFLLEPDEASPNLPLQRDSALRKELAHKSKQDIMAVFDKIGSSREADAVDAKMFERMNNVYFPYAMTTRLTPREAFSPALQKKFSPSDQLLKVIESWSPEVQEKIKTRWHPLHTVMYSWSKSQLPNYLLTALGDRCEMAHSIEGRPPFLDHKLAELLGSIPPSLKIHYGSEGQGPDAGNSAWYNKAEPQAAAQFWEKWILREAAKPFITEELYLRRKHPYTAPVLWPKEGPLHKLFQRLLTEENVEALGFIHWPEVQQSLEEGFGKNANPQATRKCYMVGSFVALSKRFGVAQAQVDRGSML